MTGTRLQRLVARSTEQSGVPGPHSAGDAPERCELCGEPVPGEHRHVVDLSARKLCCACRACSILFDSPAAGGGRYRLVPHRRWYLRDFALEDAAWERLRIPVQLAFFFHDSAVQRVVAFYPSPAGAVESLVAPNTWEQIAADNPVLGRLERDVEALLVSRRQGGADHFLVPIDDCYALVGLIRTQWRGLSGGRQVWDAIGEFFADLRDRARPVAAT